MVRVLAFVTYNTWQTQDGKWYASAYTNNAYIAQDINSTAYGTYNLSAWYRLPTAFSGASGDTCTLIVALDSTTLWSNKYTYGKATVGNTPEKQLTATGISYTASNAGIFKIS